MITDMEPTVDRIVKASTLPLSIVIVGVGGANFSAMVGIHEFLCVWCAYDSDLSIVSVCSIRDNK